MAWALPFLKNIGEKNGKLLCLPGVKAQIESMERKPKPKDTQPLLSLASLHKTDSRKVDFSENVLISTLSIFSIGGKSSKLFQMVSIGFVYQKLFAEIVEILHNIRDKNIDSPEDLVSPCSAESPFIFTSNFSENST